MFSRYSFKTGSFFSLHPSFPAFLPFSLSLPDPSFFPSFHLWRTCCVPGTMSSPAHKKARRERRSLCLGKVWSGGGVSPAHRGPRPAHCLLSHCLFLSLEMCWTPAAPVGPHVICGCSGLTAAAPRCCSRPAKPVIFALWLLPQVH